MNILARHEDADLDVYAIWFSMYPTDRREVWPADVLTDSRVVHYWDDAKQIGTWYARQFNEMKSTVDPTSNDLGGPILWDAYLVYGPESRWDEAPSGLRRWGRTILRTQDSLILAVTDALRPSTR